MKTKTQKTKKIPSKVDDHGKRLKDYFEIKVLHKIFGLVRVGDDCRIRYNGELYELINDVVQRINNQRLRWLGHALRMEEDAPAKRVFDAESAAVGEEGDLVSIGRIKSRKPCHRLIVM